MSDSIKLKIAINLIVLGLYEKEYNKTKGLYPYSKNLIHGINLFQSLNLKYNKKEFDFSKLHEQAFIQDYAMKPISQWFLNWKDIEKLNLNKQKFYHMEDPLVGDTGFHTFHMSDEAEDYLQYDIEYDVIAGEEQRAVYNGLKELNQQDYVYLRKYIIEHPIIDIVALRKLKLTYAPNDIALQVIEDAYELIKDDCFICPKCGWTLYKEKLGFRCQSRLCSEEKYISGELKTISKDKNIFRLKRGVMKYIAVPGKLELEIYNYCNKHKIGSELWPEMDTYDLKIIFSNQETWAIDAKAVRKPYILKEAIKKDNGFPIGDYQKGFFVIPNEYAEDRTDYIKIINKQLKELGNDKIKCLKVGDLKRKIREEAKHSCMN